ncbi:MAG TPA: ABC transporter ATP-binding protein [Polyangiaceae bacterium]|nr:ABC transporter ATP-binding protein [Polyangiaceae bacterium]
MVSLPVVVNPNSPPDRSLAQVRAEDITKLFGPVPALRGVSHTFQAGTVTFLTGPNGAGKSTLLAVLGTRLAPTRGRVRYLTKSGDELERSEVRAQLGWVSHETHCYGELSGQENLRLVAELQGVGAEEIGAVSERVELGRFAERPVATLSRGQRQRVALARALVHSPELLLLDEPWTGLDVGSARLLERIVLEERDRGALVLVVSHEPDLAERLGARELLLVSGRTAQSSSRR